jgi:hypothetical protein
LKAAKISEARGRARLGAGGSAGIDSGAGIGSAAGLSAHAGSKGGGGDAGWLASVDQISAAASNLLAAVCTDVVRASLDSAISVSLT